LRRAYRGAFVSINCALKGANVVKVTTSGYDAASNLRDVVQSNGVIADYAYNDLGQLVSLIHFVDGTGGDADGIFTVCGWLR
jgi:hypothetical protein